MGLVYSPSTAADTDMETFKTGKHDDVSTEWRGADSAQYRDT